MRLEALRSEATPEGGRRVSARVVWEGPHRGPPTLWFETQAPFAQDLEPAPEAFAVAAMPMACGLGEPRLLVEGSLCTRLRRGLEASMRLFAHWFPSCRVVPVEATEGFVPRWPRERGRAGAFVSGGVDSLSLLRTNATTYPPDHPARVRDAIHLFGWHLEDLAGDAPHPERWRAYVEQGARLRRLGERTGFEVIPVRSNVRRFHPTWAFSHDVGFGAGMIATAHALGRRLTAVGFASTGDVGGRMPHASHPLLDAHHSTGALEVRMEEPCVERLRKVETVAAWDDGLAALQVCLLHEVPPPGRANCGACEKCVRTALELLALGALDRAVTFPRRDVTTADVAKVRLPTPTQQIFAAEVLPLLAARGRNDLVAALRTRIRKARRHERVKAWRRRFLGRRDPRAG